MAQPRTAKQQRSEQRRVLAIEQTRKLMIKKSKINISTPHGTHIVFESDCDGSGEDSNRRYGEEEEKTADVATAALTRKKVNGAYTKKITGKMADQWLGFDSDDDGQSSGTSSSESRDDVIPSRPQFEGKRGAKLMRLQRQVGQDKRFEVTQSFLDEASSDDGNAESQGDLENKFEREKAMSLAVLQSVVGSKIGMQRKREVTNKRGISIQRYDPADKRCADLEVKHKGKQETAEHVQTVKKSFKASTTGEHPIVSEERFYSVEGDLNFSGGQGPQSFSFLEMLGRPDEEMLGRPDEEMLGRPDEEMLGRPDEEMQSNTAVQITVGEDTKKSRKWQAKKRLVTQLDSSSDDGNEVTEDQQTLQADEQNADDDNGFFFLFDDSGNFKGRLADGVRRFMRTQSVEEIETKWKLSRKALAQDYRKKRKDALRRIKKSKLHRSVSKA